MGLQPISSTKIIKIERSNNKIIIIMIERRKRQRLKQTASIIVQSKISRAVNFVYFMIFYSIMKFSFAKRSITMAVDNKS